MNITTVGDLVSIDSASTNPGAKPFEIFHVYTLPGFDDSKRIDLLKGSAVKSAKDSVSTDSILFNKLNVRFKRIWNIKTTPDNSICSSEFLRLKVKNCDQDYLFHFLHTTSVTEYLSSASGGTSHSHSRISPSDLLRIPVLLPDIETQKNIGKFLTLIDKKIDTNNAVRNNLNSLITTLYDHWFVQFDFPDIHGDPYKFTGGELTRISGTDRYVPKGWYTSAVGNVVELQTGTSYTSNDIETSSGLPMINLGSIDKNREYRDEKIKYFSGAISNDKVVYPGEMLLACTDLTSDGLIIGCPIFVPKHHDQFTYSMDLSKVDITSNKVLPTYLYMTLRTDWYHKYIKRFASGTNVRHLDVNGVKRYIIVLPPKELQQKFENIVRPMFDKINDSLIENQQLSQLRDWLLPVLMNGQVKILDKESR